MQFARYYHAVNEPLKALKQIQNGQLNNETMEALQAVHPDLLNEMRQVVINHMNVEQARKLPYAKKLALSKFLGQPMDESMTSAMIQSNQNSFNPPPPPQPQTQGRGPKTTLGGLKQLKVASRTATQTHQEEKE
jgi:hypothetical protein